MDKRKNSPLSETQLREYFKSKHQVITTAPPVARHNPDDPYAPPMTPDQVDVHNREIAAKQPLPTGIFIPRPKVNVNKIE